MIRRVALVALLSVLSVRIVDASSFGRTAGNFGVSATGNAQYTIPIWAPPGPKGIQPNLSLSYNSSAGIGPLGVGWFVAGLGAITRCNQTYAQDTTPAAVALLVSDGYCLNGNRLRLTSGTYGTDSSTYQTEIANFSNITAHGAAGNGPAYFTVQGSDGNTYQYGFTDTNGNGAGSQVLAAPTATASTWLLSKVIDRAGNNFVINYTTLTGTAVPANISWTPTSAGASTYTYEMIFNYGTPNVPPSSISKYVGGTAVSNSNLLTSISISASGAIIKDYFLGYQVSPTTGRNELTSVTECADSAKSNCLLPTNVAYQNGAAGVASPATTSGSGSTNGTVYSVDIDGDGRKDLVFAVTSGSNYQWWVQLATAAGYGAPINTSAVTVGTTDFLLDNFDALGETEILAPVGGVFYAYKWNGSSFTATSTGLAVVSGAQYASADVDGDGRPDIVYLTNVTSSTPNENILLNTTSGTSISFASTPVVNTLSLPNFTFGMQLFGNNQQPNSSVKTFDFDGDGRQDLAIAYTFVSPFRGGTGVYEISLLISRGTTAPVQIGQLSEPLTAGETLNFVAVNWNDDACTDIALGNEVWVAQCNGNAVQYVSLPGNAALALDWDGDGRTDVLANVGGIWEVYRSEGSGVAAGVSTGIAVASGTYIVTDQNGDGLDDLAFANSSAGNAIYYGLHNGAGQPPDLAIDFYDGFIVKYTAAYVALSQATSANYTKGTSQVFPQQDYDGPRYVTQYALMPNGIGTTYTLHYDYTGAVMNLQGRGFQGFTTVNVLSDQVHFNDKKTYSTGTLSGGIVIPTAGMLLGETVITTGGTNVRNAQYTLGTLTLDATANNQRYFPYTASSSANTYEIQPGNIYNGKLITTTTTNYNTPDIYGNFSDISTTVTDADSGSPYYNQQWTTTTAATISPDPSTWCNSLPTERDVTNTAPGVPAITRHLSFTPDYTACRETQQVVESGNATYQVTTGYGFDAFGNIDSQTVTGIGMPARTTAINWGITGQFPTQVTNPLNQISYPSFDSVTGQILSINDPNNILTSWQYDPFGRKNKESRPDGTSTTWAYNNCATAGCVNSNNHMTVVQTNVNSDGSTLNIQNTYQDEFDRVLVTSKQMLNGAYDRNEVQYNALGTVQQQAAPCTFVSCVYYWTTKSYDNLKRLTQIQRPISATNGTLQTTTIQHSGRATIVTDPQGKVTTNITKVTGKVGRTQDNNGYYVNFNHDAFGSLLSVTDSLSNTLRTMTYAYGLKAFRTSLADMDLGTRTYTTDALGEVTAYSDGKGQSFSAIFDALSRMTSRTEPDLISTWTWGATAASHNIGKLASVSSTGSGGTYSESYTFDSIGRLSNDSITVTNDGTVAFDFTYSATTGLLSTIAYPLSGQMTYRITPGYTYQHGILQQIFDSRTPTTIWWQANAMNPRGQITQETTEDLSGHPQIVSNRTYDAVTGWLASTQTGPGGGATLQNEAYLYDEMGNVTQRQNNNLGLTENFYYDNLYRLDHSMLGGSVNLQMAYDAMGDITSRSDVAGGATWTYDPVRKHAVTQAGSSAFTYVYDANGNVRSRNGSFIGWTSYNYPNNVNTATESALFNYGPNRQRWSMVYNGPAGQEITYYATPLYERMYAGGLSTSRHYIYAASRPVVEVSTYNGVVTVQSLLVDHQGSISSVVTDSTGASLVSESFTAYGNRREASTWTGAPTSGELTTMNGVTRQGYTFQTVLGSMGLNHMNGRIEDSVTGRFLSPDPRGIIRGNTQSRNRYSYVNNNPLTMSDPTGFGTICDADGSGCTVTADGGGGGGGAPAAAGGGGGFGSPSSPPAFSPPTVRTPPVPTHTDNGTGTGNKNTDGTPTPGVPGQFVSTDPSGMQTVTGIGSSSAPRSDVTVESGIQTVAAWNNIATLAQFTFSKFRAPKVVSAFAAALNKITGVADALNDDIEANDLSLEMSLLTAAADLDAPYAAGQVLYQTIIVPLGNDMDQDFAGLNQQFYDSITDPDPITGPPSVFE